MCGNGYAFPSAHPLSAHQGARPKAKEPGRYHFVMNSALDQRDMLRDAWRTGNAFLINNVPDELGEPHCPGLGGGPFRMIGGQIHDAQCM
jgi:hypothetical protein